MKGKLICGILIAMLLLAATIMPMGVLATGADSEASASAEETTSQGETAITEDTASSENAPEETDPVEETDPEETDPEETDPEETEPEETEPEETEPEETEPEETEPEETVPEETVPEETTPPDDNMHISDAMMALLKKLEGFAPYAYWDYKQYSIGYGSKCPTGMEQYYMQNPITEAYAEELLRGELDYFEKEVNDFLKENDLTVAQNQYDALVSFSYNCGAGWTNRMTSYFTTGVLSGDVGGQFVYGMMLWSTAGGKYVLLPRRIVETEVYVNADYTYRWVPEHDRYRYVFLDAVGGTTDYKVHGFDTQDPTYIRTIMEQAPVGPDETGALVTYVFDGWYTAREGGTKVEVLDDTIVTGSMLYAHWKTPAGTPVVMPQEDAGISLEITVTGSKVNVRCGPYTYYAVTSQKVRGDKIQIVEIVKGGNYTWGRFEDGWISLENTDYFTIMENYFPIWGKVTQDNVELRTGAGTNNSVVQGITKMKDNLVLIKTWQTDSSGKAWGETEEGWILMSNVTFEGVTVENKPVQSITITDMPGKLSYVQMGEEPDLTGGLLLVTFADGSTQVLDMTLATVTDFDNSQLGQTTVTITYREAAAAFEVEIIKATVIFQMEDGTILSQKEYAYGETVELPEDPTKPTDSNGYYIFSGWDKEVTTCAGNAVYTAVFEQRKLTGNFNEDDKVDDQDVIYLLRHVYFPDRYPIDEPVDYNKDGQMNDQDVIYLLRHVYFPERYPL